MPLALVAILIGSLAAAAVAPPPRLAALPAGLDPNSMRLPPAAFVAINSILIVHFLT